MQPRLHLHGEVRGVGGDYHEKDMDVSGAGASSRECVISRLGAPARTLRTACRTLAHAEDARRQRAHDAVWSLSSTSARRELIRWRIQEIGEAGGQAHVWIVHQERPGQDEQLVTAFIERANDAFHALAGELVPARVELADM